MADGAFLGEFYTYGWRKITDLHLNTFVVCVDANENVSTP
jgi:hypothetical protein